MKPSDRRTCTVAVSLVLITVSFLIFRMPVGATVDEKNRPGSVTSEPPGSYQLPKSVTPDSYELSLCPDLEKFTFEGSETIAVTVHSGVRTVTLNALDLEIKSATVTSASFGDQEGKISLDPDHELASISFAKQLDPGQYQLNLKFSGSLNDNLRGFYRSYYKDDSGAKHWLATTQMEPTDARRMFPCFDEPTMKATYKISAVIPENMVAISNGAVVKEEPLAGSKKKVVSFEATPIMSSYLVALIIGEFKPTEARQSCGIPVRVWAPAGKESMAGYALDTACKVLQYQTEYFGIPYPGKKLDLIAIPDFRSGAMENLGAITFREAALLVDKTTGSNFLKRRVSGIVAHEIAHQWFGDLVTMKWWDDIWLNEAFASWMATKTVNHIHPEWQEITRSVLTRNESMNIDQLQATRAIHAHVENPKQAAEMFDPITYDKGESVLRMLEGFVGEKSFQEGINDYLNGHKFGNASSEDLWQSIAGKSSAPVPAIMKTWVFQAGFPIVSLDHVNAKQLKLTQKRFFGTPDANTNASSLWMVPMVVRNLATNQPPPTGQSVLLTKTVQDIEPAGIEKKHPYFINAGGMGYYRSFYGLEGNKSIADSFQLLTAQEKLAFLSDTAAQAWNGALPVEDRLNLTRQIANEKDPIVLNALVGEAHKIFDFLHSSPERTAYVAKLQKLLLPVKQRIGWTEKSGEQDSIKDLRESLITLLGVTGEPDTVAEARQYYSKFMKDHSSIPPDIIATVLTVVAYNGGANEYQQLMEAWKCERVPELEKRFLSKLGVFQQPDLIEKTLTLSLSSDVRAQDGFRLISDLLSYDASKHIALDFMQKHWKEISEKFPPRSLSAIATACQSFDTLQDEKAVNEFFKANPLSSGKSAVARMLEQMHAAVLYRQRNEEKILSWAK